MVYKSATVMALTTNSGKEAYARVYLRPCETREQAERRAASEIHKFVRNAGFSIAGVVGRKA